MYGFYVSVNLYCLHFCQKIESSVILIQNFYHHCVSEGVDWIHLKMAVFWVVAPCSVVEVYQRFRGTFFLHHQITLMMEVASTSETSVNFYQTTQCYNPEDSHLRTCRCENLESCLYWSGSGKCPLMDYCEYRTESSDSIKHKEFLD
jgi:hypothetical protein